MAVTEQDVRHVAQLARLGIDAAELPRLVSELNGILEHMDVLRQVALDALDASDADAGSAGIPLAMGMPLRPDGTPPIPLLHPRESFAPAMRDGFFLVPRLATHGTVGTSASDDLSTEDGE